MIRMEDVSYSYGKKEVLHHFNLHVKEGEFLTVIGCSGCGKTTMLKLINALLLPSLGTVYVQGRDEPFGALDEITRKMMQKELLALHKKLGLTVVFITHDIREAMKLGDRVLVMDQGRAIQLDKPEVILEHPANAFVQELISD